VAENGRYVDLSPLVPSDITVKLQVDGPEYLIPGDIPVPSMLTFLELENELEEVSNDDGEAIAGVIREMYDKLLELFQERQPDLEELPIHLPQIPTLIREVQALYNGADKDVEERPTPAQSRTRSPRSSRPSRAKASRAKPRSGTRSSKTS
jgi:hypothetical protein